MHIQEIDGTLTDKYTELGTLKELNIKCPLGMFE